MTQHWSRDKALAALVEDYMVDVEMHGNDVSCLAFAHRRKDVYALNQSIRAALRASDTPKSELLYETETGPRAFTEGDRIVFTRNDKSLGVKNGMLGLVTRTARNEIIVNLDNDTGTRRTVAFNPKAYRAFDHGYAFGGPLQSHQVIDFHGSSVEKYQIKLDVLFREIHALIDESTGNRADFQGGKPHVISV